jgi:hypothetical protein
MANSDGETARKIAACGREAIADDISRRKQMEMLA